MNQDDYVVLYADKKPEDNIIITNMFKNTLKFNIGWTDIDYNNNTKLVDEYVSEHSVNQIILAGFEIGWDKFVLYVKEKYPEMKVKVICNTNDSLLYYEYERNNFFKMLELAKDNLIDNIAFFRRGQYEVYKTLGYKCSMVYENYKMDDNMVKSIKEQNDIVDIGIYPLNYTWDKNIFNQLCIPEFIENSNLNYNNLDPRMDDFLETMRINHKQDRIESIDDESIINAVIKNDVVVATSFTEYVHPVFFISMELGIPCLIGNNSELFDESSELGKFVVTTAEDNAIINAEMIKKIIENKSKINSLYKEWKNSYNSKSMESIEEFLNK